MVVKALVVLPASLGTKSPLSRKKMGKAKSDCGWPGLGHHRALPRAEIASLPLRLAGAEKALRESRSEGWSQGEHYGAHPFPRFTVEVDGSRPPWHGNAGHLHPHGSR
jgi:hypothetical protein